MVCQKVLSAYFFHQDYLTFLIFDKRHTVVTLFWILSFILISSIFQKHTFWVDFFSLFLRRKFCSWKISDFLVRFSSCKLLGDLGFSYIYQKKIWKSLLIFFEIYVQKVRQQFLLKGIVLEISIFPIIYYSWLELFKKCFHYSHCNFCERPADLSQIYKNMKTTEVFC